MGKGKKKFIEKSKGVKIRLVYRPSQGDEYGVVDDSNDVKAGRDMVFQVLEQKGEITEEERAFRESILAQFSKKELGMDVAPNDLPKKMFDRALVTEMVKDKKDMWIHQLAKKNLEAMTNQEINEDDYEVEELEDVEEGEEDEEDINSDNYEDINSDNYDDSEGEGKNNKQEEKKKNQKQAVKDTKKIEKQPQDLKTKLLNQKEIDIRSLEISKDVKMKLYDKEGLPIDGYDYYQHIAKESNGVVTASFHSAPQPMQMAPDLDYQPEEMNDEQKEVYQALVDENEDAGYEELEDDFVNLANEGEVLIKEKAVEKQQEKTKKVNFSEIPEKEFNEVLKEFDSDGEEIASKGGYKEFSNILDDHIKSMKKEKKKEEPIPQLIPKKMIRKPSSSEEEDEDDDDEMNFNDPSKRIDYETRFQMKEKKRLEQIEKLKQMGLDVLERTQYERLPASQDPVIQRYLQKENSTDEEDYGLEEKEDVETIETRTSVNNSFAQRSLNIIGVKKGRKEGKTEIQDSVVKKEEVIAEAEELDPQEQTKSLEVDLVFQKRQKGETKEEKKQRKELIKQFKQERKIKKKTFKENFDKTRKEIKVQEANQSSLHGCSIKKID